MGPTNRVCKSGLADKSGIVKSGKKNAVKAYRTLGPGHHGCQIRNVV